MEIPVQHQPDDMLDEAEAAKVIGFSPRSMSSLRSTGRISYTKVAGSRIRYRYGDLLDLLKAHRVEATNP